MLVPIPALNDNYIWLYRRENFPVIVIDIPEITRLIPYLESNKLDVEAVLLTHNHDDHVQGVAEFKQYYPNVPVFGPAECANKGATNIVDSGVINTAHYHIEVLPSGGHTAEHVSYLVDGHLFCGDALFSGGCGRVFTGNFAQMFESMQRFNQLPNETVVCPAHEYTLGNLAFAEIILVDKSAVENQRVLVERYRAEGKPSLPTTIGLEKQINPFLQAKNLDEFTQWRLAKDKF